MRASDAEAGERNIQESGNDRWAYTEGFVIDFGHGVSISPNIDVYILGD